MPFKMGPWEIGLILLIILIIFGAGKLPQVFGSLRKGVRDFKRAKSGEDEEEEEITESTTRRRGKRRKKRSSSGSDSPKVISRRVASQGNSKDEE